MPIIELTTSRNISYGSGAPTGIREYHVSPYADEAAVLALLNGAQLPAKLQAWPSSGFFLPSVDLRVFDYQIQRIPEMPEAWLVRVIYRELGGDAITPNLAPNDAGYITMRTSIDSEFVDQWRQWPSVDDLEARARQVLNANRVPIYDVDTQQGDIGGRRIDNAGNPTSVMQHKQRVQLELTTNRRPNPNLYRSYLGTRNSTIWLGLDVGTSVFTGAEGSIMSPGKWQITFNFEVDFFFHLRQSPKRHPNGTIVLDTATGDGAAQGGGKAKIVSWIQPFPIVTEHRGINPYFVSIP